MTDLAIPHDDVQARRPATHVSLTRVGVTGVEKVIRIGVDGTEQLFFADIECFVDLGPKQKGAHMSRFEEVVNEAIDAVVLGEAFKAETLAQHIAERVRDRQEALRAEVRIAARYPERQQTPASGSETQEIYTLFGVAVASERGTRRLIGVEAHGMTACPCAQEMVAERSRERLAADGFTDDEIERVLASVPVATHNQRGIGRLYVGCVEGSMSSEIYELMKRSDEVEVVERAHMHPRFVEDCVREMARKADDEYGGFDDGTFLLARQENLETIHRHSVVAERHGLIGELRHELDDEAHVERHVTMREWLEGPAAARD